VRLSLPTWAVRSELADATDRSLELGYAHLPVIRGGELVVFTRAARPRRYVAVRTVAAYALSIVGDHCDVTATRPRLSHSP
jgi:hypothetical protein